MDTRAISRKRPAFSPLNNEARQPTASVGSISPPCVWRRLALGLHPPPTNNNGVMLYQKGGRNHERNCRIPHISPPCVCTKAKVAKGGAYLRDTMVHICNLKTCCGCCCCCCCCSGSVTSMAYNCVGWHLHTLPWLSPSPRRISRQNRIVSTFQRVWSEIRRKGKVKESKEWENRRKNSNNSNPNPTVQTTHRGCNVKVENG